MKSPTKSIHLVGASLASLATCVSFLLTSPLTARAQYSIATNHGSWVAYNDTAWHQDPNIFNGQGIESAANNYSTNSPWGRNPGPLKSDDGDTLTAQVSFTGTTLGLGMLARDFTLPGTGTDLDNVFTGHVGTDNAINWTNGTLTMTLSGLSPASLYNIAIWSSRGATTAAYSNRWTDITISHVTSFQNSSSDGLVQFQSDVPNDSVRVIAVMEGGRIARFTNVQPHIDGTIIFSLTANGASAGDRNGYLNAFVVENTEGDSITITGYNGPGGTVTVPEEFNGLPVTIIGQNSFSSRSSLTNIILPDSLTAIMNGAFAYCGNLTNVSIPDGVSLIDEFAFQHCYTLKGPALPASLTTLGQYAFFHCHAITNIVLPQYLSSYGEGAIASCSSLLNIFVDDANTNFTDIGGVLFNKPQYALIQCPAGASGSFTIPTNATRLVAYSFKGCSSITNVVFPASLTNIAPQTFIDCNYIAGYEVHPNNAYYSSTDGVLFNKTQSTLIRYPEVRGGSYSIPGTVTRIANDSFHRCQGLTNVVIPQGVTVIEGSSFDQCSGLTYVNIPASVNDIGIYAFTHLSSLIAFNVDPANLYYRSVDGVLFKRNPYTMIQCPVTKSGIYEIPDGVEVIGGFAFMDCGQMSTVIFPASCTDIGESIFTYAYPQLLSSLYFRGNAPNIGWYYLSTTSTVYYLPGTTGWTNLYANRTTAIWLPEIGGGANVGLQSNQVSFNIEWASGMGVEVQVSTNLMNPSWSSLSAFTLTNDSVRFTDPQPATLRNRFYRIRWL